MWAGLGYYRRARYLLQGAKYVTNDLAGTFPMTTSELQKIPGIFTPHSLLELTTTRTSMESFIVQCRGCEGCLSGA